MSLHLVSTNLVMPVVMSASIAISATVAESATVWEKLLEKWGIAAAMGFLLYWAVKKIDTSDKSRIELSQQMITNQEVLHKNLEEILKTSIAAQHATAGALGELKAALDARPCACKPEEHKNKS